MSPQKRAVPHLMSCNPIMVRRFPGTAYRCFRWRSSAEPSLHTRSAARLRRFTTRQLLSICGSNHDDRSRTVRWNGVAAPLVAENAPLRQAPAPINEREQYRRRRNADAWLSACRHLMGSFLCAEDSKSLQGLVLLRGPAFGEPHAISRGDVVAEP